MAITHRNSNLSTNIWPGYVDVLSALLMVVIFVLLIFTFSQFLFGFILADKSSEIATLHEQMDEIRLLLGLEREKTTQMNNRIAALNDEFKALTDTRNQLETEIERLTNLRVDDANDLELQLRTIASLQQDIDALQKYRETLENRINEVAATLYQNKELTQSLRDRSKALEDRLAEEKEMTYLAQKEIQQRDIRIEALSALIDEQQESLNQQQQLTADAKAEVLLLNKNIEKIQAQLTEIRLALGVSNEIRRQQDEKIQDLGHRLNIELAKKVNQLELYRSDFFGRLREIIGDNPVIRIEGDRFLLQAELLFDSGTSTLGEQGKFQLVRVGEVLLDIIPTIPEDLPWILRVDGHTDKVPIRSASYSSNWELSTARAVSVVRYLAQQGIPEDRMAASGFSKFHPLDPADTDDAYRKNRRIEIKLTSR